MNSEKTGFVCFSMSTRTSCEASGIVLHKSNSQGDITCGYSQRIKRLDKAMYLWVYIDQNLKWRAYVDYICIDQSKKANKYINFINFGSLLIYT